MKHGMPYSDEEDATIIAMANDARPVDQIARAVGRTRQAVTDRMDRLVAHERLSREARRSTKFQGNREPSNPGAGAGGMPIRCAGATHHSAIERARERVERMVSAGMDDHAARLQVRQESGVTV